MRTLFTTLVLLAASGAVAQSGGTQPMHTLFSNPADTVTGGFVAITGRSFNTFGQDGFVLGGRGGVIIGHRWAIGLAGYGLCTPLKNTAYNDYRSQHELDHPDGLALRMGYGGLFVEPVLFDRSVVHVSIPITFGAGGAAYGYPLDGGRYTRISHTDVQAFFFVEPAIDLEVNILPALRVGIGAAYLYTTDLSLPGTDADALRRPMLQLTLKTGVF